MGNGSFLAPRPSFPDFGDFVPCRGRTRSQSEKVLYSRSAALGNWDANPDSYFACSAENFCEFVFDLPGELALKNGGDLFVLQLFRSKA